MAVNVTVNGTLMRGLEGNQLRRAMVGFGAGGRDRPRPQSRRALLHPWGHSIECRRESGRRPGFPWSSSRIAMPRRARKSVRESAGQINHCMAVSADGTHS